MRVEPNEVAIVANPYSGAKSNADRVAALCASLSSAGLSPQTIWEPAHQSRLLANPQWRAACRCVIVAGGDGTVVSVLNAVPDLPLAILPLGNENLLARELGFDGSVVPLVKAIERHHLRTLDVARLGEKRFALMVSAGFDGETAHRLAQWRAADPKHLRRVRHRSYVKPILTAALRYRYPIMRIVADGCEMRGALAMVVNVPRYAMNLRFAPDARSDDGLLDYVVFEKPGRFATIGYAMSLLLGRHTARADVHCGKAKHVEITSDQPVPIQVDGDAHGFTPIAVNVEPAAMTVIDMRSISE